MSKEINIQNVQALTSDLKIEKFISLITYYDISLLYHDLKNYIENKFQGGATCFAPNERLVFLNDDIDFLLDKNSVPFNLYNLQLILRELDISNVFCRVITNLPNYQVYSSRVQEKLVNDVPLPIIDSCLYFNILYDNPIRLADLNLSALTHPFVVLSRLQRFHRTYFMSQLFNYKLENKGIVTYHNIPSTADHDDTELVVGAKETPCYFLSTVPPMRHNGEIPIKNATNRQIVSQFQKNVVNYSNIDQSTAVQKKLSAMGMNTDIIQKGLIYVALETLCNHPMPFISRISFKGIVFKRPFVIFGCAGTLKFLKSQGFKTFSDFWSEEYDQVDCIETRTNMILTILDEWAQKPLPELQSALTSMSDILEYNFLHYTTVFANNQKNKLIQGLK